MQRFVTAYVKGILRETGYVQEIEVATEEGDVAKAICYPDLTGSVREGDTVLVNVIAVELGLGTGGYHFVVANLTRPECEATQLGHIMKLRYTPLQLNVMVAEEEGSPLRNVILQTANLEKLPVILCPLHSFIAPASAGIKAIKPKAKVVYIMTDSAALPMAFSKLVPLLKSADLIDVTITCGQAFGGDIECVNVYTALLCAKGIEADAAIIASGPGHLGTASPLGFSGVEMGWLIDAVNDLGGRAIFAPRISFADPRVRHRGISHHTITVLMRLCHTKTTVVFPILRDEKAQLILNEQLKHSLIAEKHDIVWWDGSKAIDLLNELGIPLESMGRKYEDDPALFLAPAAAGIWAMK
ncbi:MAG: DUF3866 family protein [Armatimonadetes bacterium]|nr:DUF3866 family protein [Armatimonadota bacterium]MDW8027681.1 DUF3866 family protein [Armatimonadota bacterium]